MPPFLASAMMKTAPPKILSDWAVLFCLLALLFSRAALFIRPIHLNRLGIVFEAPDSAGTDARADAAADALRRVGDVFPPSVFIVDPRNRLFRAGIDAHAAVAAGAAGNAARVLLARVRQIAVMTLLEVRL